MEEAELEIILGQKKIKKIRENNTLLVEDT